MMKIPSVDEFSTDVIKANAAATALQLFQANKEKAKAKAKATIPTIASTSL